MQFLSAKWQHLLFASYCVSPDVLEPLVPRGTRLDAFEGETFVSLVAFLFKDMRVLGIPAPFYQRFEEVNLRFYVTPTHDPLVRAVCFVKEIVPLKLIPWVANNFFGENYEAVSMSHEFSDTGSRYSWGPTLCSRFEAKHTAALKLPGSGSLGEFITEHYWGYTNRNGRTLQYHVAHPQWECCEVNDYAIELDFAAEYGPRFDFLSRQRPRNVLYCHGSPVSVSTPSRLSIN
ncbi:MAG: DUF2071 domain-containing protein [Aureliella sp.]